MSRGSASRLLAAVVALWAAQQLLITLLHPTEQHEAPPVAPQPSQPATPPTPVPPVADQPCSTKLRGVALHVVLESPRNPSNFVALLHNVLAVLPVGWDVQLVHRPVVRAWLDQQPGVQRLLQAHPPRVRLTEVAPSHMAMDRKALLLSPWLWQQAHAEAVLVFDTPVALCGNAPITVDDLAGHYDWVGAAWKWAKPGSPHEWGGNGALSLRNASVVLNVLQDELAQSGTNAPLSVQTRGNEDMWFVRRLFEERRQRPHIRLAPRAVSMQWVCEEVCESRPFGVYHLMRSMSAETRSKVLAFCPEARRMFDSVHPPPVRGRTPGKTRR